MRTKRRSRRHCCLSVVLIVVLMVAATADAWLLPRAATFIAASRRPPHGSLFSSQLRDTVEYCNDQDIAFIKTFLEEIDDVPPWRYHTPLKTSRSFLWLLSRSPPQEAERILTYMLENNVEITISTFNRLLNMFPPQIGEKLLQVWNTHSKADTISYNTVIHLYAKEHSIQHAQRLFDSLETPDIYSYNCLLGAYSQSGNVTATEHLYQQLLRDATVQPTSHTYNLVLQCYEKSKQPEQAAFFLKTMDCPDTTSYNIVLKAMAQVGLDASEQFFATIPAKDNVMYATMVNVYCRYCSDKMALERTRHVMDIAQREPSYNSSLLSKILYSIATVEDPGVTQYAEELVKSAAAKRMPLTIEVYDALIYCWAKAKWCNPTSRILEILEYLESPTTKLQPSIRTYTHAIDGVMEIDKAYSILQNLQMHGPKPTVHTYTSLMSKIAHSKRFEKVYQVKKLFEEMKQSGIRPTVVSYNVLLNACEHTADTSPHVLQIACNVFGELRSSTESLNHISYATFLSVLGRMMEVGPRRNELIRAVWDLCKEQGLVSPVVLQKLQNHYEHYPELLNGHDKSNLPVSWTKNVRNDRAREYSD